MRTTWGGPASASAWCGGGQGRGHPASKLPGPQRRPDKETASFHPSASPGPSPPHAASRTLFRTKKSVRSDAHYVGRTGFRLGLVRRRAGTRPSRIETAWTPAPPGQWQQPTIIKNFARSFAGAHCAGKDRALFSCFGSFMPVPPRPPARGPGSGCRPPDRACRPSTAALPLPRRAVPPAGLRRSDWRR